MGGEKLRFSGDFMHLLPVLVASFAGTTMQQDEGVDEMKHGHGKLRSDKNNSANVLE